MGHWDGSEFRTRDTYAPLTAMVGGGPFGLKAGEWTDYSGHGPRSGRQFGSPGRFSMSKTFWAVLAVRHCSCTGKCFDICITTQTIVASMESHKEPLLGSTDPTSAGNGSLMRLEPAAVPFGMIEYDCKASLVVCGRWRGRQAGVGRGPALSAGLNDSQMDRASLCFALVSSPNRLSS